jgi:vacuolar-type H+-ATPase subunit I/STV1
MKNGEEKIEELEKSVSDLEKKLNSNEENDQKRHDEIKQLQIQQHEDDKFRNQMTSVGTFTTPFMIAFAPFIEKFLGKGANKEKNLTQQTSDTQQKET